MTDIRFPGCRVHPTALIEDDVQIGEGTSVWDSVHIRHGARIGRNCIIGEKTYIAYDVKIGDYCKLNANVYICAGVTISDYVMLAAHTVFTNDRYPRSFDRALDGLASSDPNEETLETFVGVGVTTGAQVTIGPGLKIGDFAMVGMGSVVNHNVAPHALEVGNRSRLVGYVCTCGPVLVTLPAWEQDQADARYSCVRCGRVFAKTAEGVREVSGVTKRH
jgi:UDP-2-acetamido-3-amino-2,3-dideoxy-glucuronate N-acetyltransferase